jgi:hypothetical protein
MKESTKKAIVTEARKLKVSKANIKECGDEVLVTAPGSNDPKSFRAFCHAIKESLSIAGERVKDLDLKRVGDKLQCVISRVTGGNPLTEKFHALVDSGMSSDKATIELMKEGYSFDEIQEAIGEEDREGQVSESDEDNDLAVAEALAEVWDDAAPLMDAIDNDLEDLDAGEALVELAEEWNRNRSLTTEDIAIVIEKASSNKKTWSRFVSLVKENRTQDVAGVDEDERQTMLWSIGMTMGDRVTESKLKVIASLKDPTSRQKQSRYLATEAGKFLRAPYGEKHVMNFLSSLNERNVSKVIREAQEFYAHRDEYEVVEDDVWDGDVDGTDLIGAFNRMPYSDGTGEGEGTFDFTGGELADAMPTEEDSRSSKLMEDLQTMISNGVKREKAMKILAEKHGTKALNEALEVNAEPEMVKGAEYGPDEFEAELAGVKPGVKLKDTVKHNDFVVSRDDVKRMRSASEPLELDDETGGMDIPTSATDPLADYFDIGYEELPVAIRDALGRALQPERVATDGKEFVVVMSDEEAEPVMEKAKVTPNFLGKKKIDEAMTVFTFKK